MGNNPFIGRKSSYLEEKIRESTETTSGSQHVGKKYTNQEMRIMLGNEQDPLEKAADDLVWAIESLIDTPYNVKSWFLVKDYIEKYKIAKRSKR